MTSQTNITSHCNVFYIENFELKDKICPSEEELDRALNFIDKNKIKYGDLVLFSNHVGYRNEGVTIYDGEKIVDLYAQLDDYGSLPPNFKVLQQNKYGVEIDLYHWHNVLDKKAVSIDHNYIVWFDQIDYYDQIEKNLTFDKNLFDGFYALYSFFNDYKNRKIYIVYSFQYKEEDEGDSEYDSEYNISKEKLEFYKKEFLSLMKEKNVIYNCLDKTWYKKTNENILHINSSFCSLKDFLNEKEDFVNKFGGSD